MRKHGHLYGRKPLKYSEAYLKMDKRSEILRNKEKVKFELYETLKHQK